jgi:hypothetical protein
VTSPLGYDDVAKIFLAPIDPPPRPPRVPDSPARRLRDALEPIATQGWWSRPPNDRMAALGLGFLDGYVWGRAAPLGEPSAPVVVAAFGAFEPSMLTAVYEHARSTVPRHLVLDARERGAIEQLAEVVDEDAADAISAPLLVALADLDATGRPLFAALRALPIPDEPVGRLWRAAELVREHRGDGHVAACVASGLDVVSLNVLTELWLGWRLGEYSATRGFSPERIDAAAATLTERGFVSDGGLTDAGRHARDALEHATDASQALLLAALGGRVDDLVDRAALVSERLIAAHAFPPDPRKRAAG